MRSYAYLLNEPKHADAEDVLILSADQLYGMDYSALINYHRLKNADVTIATTPAGEEAATHLGVLQVDEHMNVTGFAEKPERRVLSTMSVDTGSCYGEQEFLTVFFCLCVGSAPPPPSPPPLSSTACAPRSTPAPSKKNTKKTQKTTTTKQKGLDAVDAQERPYVASMGVYVFKKAVLLDLLCNAFPDAKDFSRDILAVLAGSIKIAAYPFHDYFEDVGTLASYYAANLALARSVSVIFFMLLLSLFAALLWGSARTQKMRQQRRRRGRRR